MKSPRIAVGLSVLNLLVLALLFTGRAGADQHPPVTPILRTRVLELVDSRGQVRSRLNVEPSGEVMLRLLDPQGTIRVKLGAGEGGSGLVLLDEATEPAVHIVARRRSTSASPATTSITLRGSENTPRVFRP